MFDALIILLSASTRTNISAAFRARVVIPLIIILLKKSNNMILLFSVNNILAPKNKIDKACKPAHDTGTVS